MSKLKCNDVGSKPTVRHESDTMTKGTDNTR